MGLSTVVLTNKDPNEIRPTLDSISFADETVLVRDHPGYDPLAGDFAAQRNLGLARAKGEWVLFVDDDEVVSEPLRKEIGKAIADGRHDAFYLKRRDVYFGQTIKHGETGNIKIIRLAKKTAGKFVRPVHEVWQVEGKVGQLFHPFTHERGELVTPFLDRISLYGPLDAAALKREGKPFSSWRLVLNPVGKFLVNYVLKLGLLDGYLGLFQSYLMSVQSISVRVFQWQNES